jgi:hypothetical protein
MSTIDFADAMGQERARLLFDRASWRSRLRRALGAAGESHDGDILERVRLPVAAAAARDEATRFHVVERVLGHAWAVSSATPLAAADSRSIATEDLEATGSTTLPARLTIEECGRTRSVVVVRVGARRGRAGDLLEPWCDASYPFWLRYQRDRRGRLDFEAVDAVTGRRVAGPLRAAIAAALIDASTD